MRTLVQLRLSSGTHRLTTWVEQDRRLAIGGRLTLKDFAEPDRLWQVDAISTPHQASDVKRGWNNNI